MKFSPGLSILRSVCSNEEILPSMPTHNGAVQQEILSVNNSYFAPHRSSFSIETNWQPSLGRQYLTCVEFHLMI